MEGEKKTRDNKGGEAKSLSLLAVREIPQFSQTLKKHTDGKQVLHQTESQKNGIIHRL